MQPNLFDRTLQDRFEQYHAANPHVYEMLLKIARRWKAAGRRHCSMDMLFNVLRFEIGVETTGDEFTLNNNYRSRYTRKMIAEYPAEFDGFFEIRELRAA
jgi:hypothetical protein